MVNDITFSEEALRIAIDNDLTVMGTSDIHGLVDYQYDIAEGGHRPICLVFCKERTAESIKEALFEGRTVTWFKDILAGKEQWLHQLVTASIQVKNKGYIGDTDILQIELHNLSDALFVMKNQSVYDFYSDTDVIILGPQEKKTLQVLAARADTGTTPLTFDILNAVKAYKQVLSFSIDLD